MSFQKKYKNKIVAFIIVTAAYTLLLHYHSPAAPAVFILVSMFFYAGPFFKAIHFVSHSRWLDTTVPLFDFVEHSTMLICTTGFILGSFFSWCLAPLPVNLFNTNLPAIILLIFQLIPQNVFSNRHHLFLLFYMAVQIFITGWLLFHFSDFSLSSILWFYLTALQLKAGMAFFIIRLRIMQSNILFQNTELFRRYLFSFILISAYLWYTYLLTGYYVNLPEQIFYFKHLSLFWISFLAVFLFLIPFLMLLPYSFIHEKVILPVAAYIVIAGVFAEVSLLFSFKSLIIVAFLGFIFLIMHIAKWRSFFFFFVCCFIISGCGHDPASPGYNYYPDMFARPVAGAFDTCSFFRDSLAMQIPIKGTVPREMIPHPFLKTERDLAKQQIAEPIVPDSAAISRGRLLYSLCCRNCHGSRGNGQGFLYTSKLYPQLPADLLSEKIDSATNSELYHVITRGFNLMGSHSAMLKPNERYEIVTYIRFLNDSADTAGLR